MGKIINLKNYSKKVRIPATIVEHFKTDEGMDETIREALIQNAVEYDKKLMESGELEKVDVPPDMYDRIVNSLKDKGIWVYPVGQEPEATLTEFEKKALEKGRKAVKHNKRNKALKIVGILFMMLTGYMLLNINSNASLKYIVDSVAEFIGGELMIKFSSREGVSTETELKDTFDMEKIYEDISNSTGIKSIRLKIYPVGLEFKTYSADSIKKEVILQYTLNGSDTIIKMSRDKDTDNTKESAVDSVTVEFVPEKVDIYQVNLSGKETYTASFEFNKTYYSITGVMKLEEFKKLVETIYF